MRISDWSSDVCSSDLRLPPARSIGRLGGGILSQRTANKNEAGRGISSVTKAYPSRDARPRMTTYEEARSGYFVHVPECFNAVIDIVERLASEAPDRFALEMVVADGGTFDPQTLRDFDTNVNTAAKTFLGIG